MATATTPTDPVRNFTNSDWSRFDLTSIELPQSIEELETEINTNLDKLEEALPVPLDSILHLQRTVWDTAYAMTKVAGESVSEASDAIVGQAKASAERMTDTFTQQADVVRADFTRMTEATRNAVSDMAKTVERSNEKIAETVSDLGDQVAGK